MILNPRLLLMTLAAWLLLLVGALAGPNSANSANSGESALGGYQPNYQVELGKVLSKPLNAMGIYLDFKKAALGFSIGTDGSSSTASSNSLKNPSGDLNASANAARNQPYYTGERGNWSVSGTDSNRSISSGKTNYQINDEIDGYVVATDQDGKKYIFGQDPLVGTKTGTLDTKWSDRQFYDRLKSMETTVKGTQNTVARTRLQKAIEVTRAVLKVLKGSDLDP